MSNRSNLMAPLILPAGIKVYIDDPVNGSGYWSQSIRTERLGVLVDGEFDEPEQHLFSNVYVRMDELRAMHLVDARTLARLAGASLSKDDARKVNELILRAMEAGPTVDDDAEQSPEHAVGALAPAV